MEQSGRVRSPAMADEHDCVSDRLVATAGWAIIVVATLVFAWFITFGHGDLLATRPYAGFFDLQSRAMAHGHLWVPNGSLGDEGFVIDGRTYAYFGPFPSALRLPIFAVTDQLDGRLSALSMIVAYALALRGCLGLLRNARALVRPGISWTRNGALIALGAMVVFALGSNLFFLASAAWVYHEASLWGAAGVLASFAAITSYLRRPRWQAVAAAGAWATVAWLSRGSVGLGPSVALGLIGLDHLLDVGLVRALAPRPPVFSADALSGEDPTSPTADPAADGGPGLRVAGARRRRLGVALLAAGALGAVAFGLINTAKFGSPTALPLNKQVGSQHPLGNRQQAFKAYNGTLFSKRLIPVTVAHSLRPDLVAPTAVFPYLRFTHAAPFDLGHPVFDTVEPTAGLTVTEPALLFGAAAGIALAFRSRRPHRGRLRRERGATPDGLSALRPLLLGAAAGALTPFTIAFIAQRYLTDVFPLLAVGAVAAVAAVDRWSVATPPALLRPAVAVATVLAVIGLFVTVSTSWSFQRLMIPPSPKVRAEALRTQANVGRQLGRPPSVRRGPTLPAKVVTDAIFVVGGCDGVYFGQSDDFWSPVERRAGAGVHRLEVPAAALDRDQETTVVSVGEGPRRLLFTARPAGSGRLVMELHVGDGVVRGAPFDAPKGNDNLVLDVDVDPTRNAVSVTSGGRDLLFTFGRAEVSEPVTPSEGVREVPIPTPTCDALSRHR